VQSLTEANGISSIPFVPPHRPKKLQKADAKLLQAARSSEPLLDEAVVHSAFGVQASGGLGSSTIEQVRFLRASEHAWPRLES